MRREDVYRYFTLDSQLHEAVSNWIKKKTLGTFYQDRPFTVNNIANVGGGQLGVNVDFQVPPMNDYVQEIYNIDIEELEKY